MVCDFNINFSYIYIQVRLKLFTENFKNEETC